MAEQITLAAERRTVLGKKVRALRRDGIIPANLYGRGRQSVALQLEAHAIQRLLETHGGSRVLRLRVDGTDENAVIRRVQREPATGRLFHIDFLHIKMTEKMRARVPLRLVGEAPAARQLGGILLHLVDALEVECLPRDLPEALELDVTGLEELDASLQARDVPLPHGVTLLSDPAETVARMTPPRMVEEEVPAAAAPAAEEAPAAEPAAEEAPK
jgi:large subunit ribosomal protein L25